MIGSRREKIAVALSGGVDSAVAAALLKKQGYAVIGLFAKTWTPTPGDGTTCTWVADRRDALRVAATLDIPLVTIDAEAAYRREVLEPWIAGYRRGETPNPDVWCNRVVKFGVLWQAAQKLGASSLATGHYARIEMSNQPSNRDSLVNDKSPSHNSACVLPYLLRGNDMSKDQSYFLWDIPAEALPYIRFPIGHLTKVAVRRLARYFGLPVANKKDSQGICLFGPTDVRTFLRRQLRSDSGPVYDWTNGQRIGRHAGLVGLTVGQRHGVQIEEIKNQESERKARYIIALDTARNCLWVGPREALLHNEVVVREINWLDPTMVESLTAGGMYQVQAQIRYRQRPVLATLRPVKNSRLAVTFETPVTAPTPGQSIVFYEGNRVLGGAVIDQVVENKVI